jgi:excisionase family DNA binding protein
MENVFLTNLSSDDIKNIVKSALEEIKPEGKKEEPELIKISEVSKILKVSLPTIHTWKKQGKIPFYRLGSKIFFKRNEVLEVLKKVN